MVQTVKLFQLALGMKATHNVQKLAEQHQLLMLQQQNVQKPAGCCTVCSRGSLAHMYMQ